MRMKWAIAGILAAASVVGGCTSRELTPQQLRADAAFCLAKIRALHPEPAAYIGESAYADWQASFAAGLDRAMTAVEFYRVLAPRVAALRSGHTFLYPPQGAFNAWLEFQGRRFPIAVGATEAGAFELLDPLELTDAPGGSVILSIDGQPAEAVFARMAAGLPGERRAVNATKLESTAVLQCLLWAYGLGDADGLAMTVRTPAGRRRSLVVPALAEVEIDERIERRGGGYRFSRYSMERRSDGRVAVMRIDAFAEPYWFHRYLASAMNALRDEPPEALVIDLRRNSGGRVRLAGLLMAVLIDRPYRLYQTVAIKGRSGLATYAVPTLDAAEGGPVWEGPIAVLIGPNTASAAAAFAGAARAYGLATLIGRPTGGLGGVYGNPGRFLLPHSELKLAVASNYAVITGAEPEQPIAPDVLVDNPAEDWRAVEGWLRQVKGR